MQIGRSVFDLLELWGEWERKGADTSIGLDLRTRDGKGFKPALADDEWPEIHASMLKIKNTAPGHYRVLKMIYIWGYSSRRIAAFEHISRHEAERRCGAAHGYAEAVMVDIVYHGQAAQSAVASIA